MKRILLAMIWVLLAHMAQGQAKKEEVIRFGLVTDIQYADADSRGSRFYRNSLGKLKESIRFFNQERLPFMLNMGDITDRNPKDLDTVLSILKGFKKTVYTTPGNHDFAGIGDNRALYRKLQMPTEYYSFKKGNWRFIMLNTNEVAAYANIAGTPKQEQYEAMIRAIKARKGKNAEEYNGGISRQQLQWLKKLLEQSQKKQERVLIFSHHPMGCAEGLTALNDQEIIGLVARFSCVKAFIAGHHHAGAFCEINGIPCIVAEGMVETETRNAYGVVELYPHKIVLTGYGKMTSRSIEIK